MGKSRYVGSTNFPFFKIKSETEPTSTETTPLLPPDPTAQPSTSALNSVTPDSQKAKKSKRRHSAKIPQIAEPEDHVENQPDEFAKRINDLEKTKEKLAQLQLTPKRRSEIDNRIQELELLLTAEPLDKKTILQRYEQLTTCISKSATLDQTLHTKTQADISPPTDAHINTSPDDLRDQLPSPPQHNPNRYGIMESKKPSFLSIFCCCRSNDEDEDLSSDHEEEVTERRDSNLSNSN